VPRLKNALLDIIVTVVIITAIATHNHILELVVVWYTPLMLLLKLVGVFSSSVVNTLQSAKTAAPVWLVYGLYAINIIVLAIAAWWWTAAEWGVIWVLSVISQKRIQAKS